MDVTHMALEIPFITDDMFPKAALPKAPFSLLQTPP